MATTTKTDKLANFQAAAEVVYGPGAVAGIGEQVLHLGVGQALVVTDEGVSRAGITARVVTALTGAGVEPVVFDAVEPNPSIETVEKALALYRDTACEGVVAVGGGSPIDAAKAVATLATNPGELSTYIGVGKIVQPLAPLFAVPTTVGTGSEVTTWAVITDLAQRKKVVLGSPLLAPRFAVLDPELVLSLPARLTASTGIDALTHAIESVISLFAGPFHRRVGIGSHPSYRRQSAGSCARAGTGSPGEPPVRQCDGRHGLQLCPDGTGSWHGPPFERLL